MGFYRGKPRLVSRAPLASPEPRAPSLEPRATAAHALAAAHAHPHDYREPVPPCVRKLPRGYGPLADQMRRALLGTYLQLTEATARDGNDRRRRFRCAKGQCNEAAAAVEGASRSGSFRRRRRTRCSVSLTG